MSRHLVGGVLLVAGTSIGAGMLALPVVTAQGGFVPALFIFFLCWLFMTCTGLLLLELCLRLPPDANIISMATRYLGKPGKAIAWVLYLFLFYCLSIAYIAGGGSLLREWIGGDFPAWAASTLFLVVLAPVVYSGARSVDRVNQVLMVGLILSYLAFVFFGLPHVNISYLGGENWPKASLALPVIFTSFSYQGVIPSLTTYLRRDPRSLRIAIIGGTTFAFVIYLIWEILILGIVPLNGPNGLLEAKELGRAAVSPLKDLIGSGAVVPIGQAFAFFAITTSFLGVTLGLLDFLADGLKLPKKGIRRLFLASLTFLPPFLVAVINPKIFISALVLAGGIGCALLLGLIPVLMAWVSRYIKKEDPADIQLGGGKIFLLFLALFVLVELFIELYQDF